MLVKKKEGPGADKIYAMKVRQVDRSDIKYSSKTNSNLNTPCSCQVLKKQAVFEKNQVEHTKAERRILRDIDHVGSLPRFADPFERVWNRELVQFVVSLPL